MCTRKTLKVSECVVVYICAHIVTRHGYIRFFLRFAFVKVYFSIQSLFMYTISNSVCSSCLLSSNFAWWWLCRSLNKSRLHCKWFNMGRREEVEEKKSRQRRRRQQQQAMMKILQHKRYLLWMQSNVSQYCFSPTEPLTSSNFANDWNVAQKWGRRRRKIKKKKQEKTISIFNFQFQAVFVAHFNGFRTSSLFFFPDYDGFTNTIALVLFVVLFVKAWFKFLFIRVFSSYCLICAVRSTTLLLSCTSSHFLTVVRLTSLSFISVSSRLLYIKNILQGWFVIWNAIEHVPGHCFCFTLCSTHSQSFFTSIRFFNRSKRKIAK